MGIEQQIDHGSEALTLVGPREDDAIRSERRESVELGPEDLGTGRRVHHELHPQRLSQSIAERLERDESTLVLIYVEEPLLDVVELLLGELPLGSTPFRERLDADTIGTGRPLIGANLLPCLGYTRIRYEVFHR